MAFLIPAIIIFLGFAVDLAHMQCTRAQLRLASDSAARAAANVLQRTDDNAQALNAAITIAAANQVAGRPLGLTSSDVQFGRSSSSNGGGYAFVAGASPPNAVRVLGKRTIGSPSGAVGLYFGGFYGMPSFQPTMTAVASFLNIDICLVLDRSSSMKVALGSSEPGLYTTDPRFCSPPYADSRWAALDAAVRGFTAILRSTNADERVGVVTYSSDITGIPALNICGGYRTTQAATIDEPLTVSMDAIDAEVHSLTTSVWNGNTYIEQGMRQGITVLRTDPSARAGAEKILIVMTDGHQNVGEARNAALDCTNQNIRCHTITFGDYADQTTMEEVAAIGGGSHRHATSASDLSSAFRELAGEIARLTE